MTSLLDTVLETIRARRDEIEARYGIRLLGVVGSVARGEERPDSDVDILADISGRPTLFTLADAQVMLEQELGRSIDLILRQELRPAALDYMTENYVEA
jgi:predicted nucleotidyltransferase